MGDFTDSGVYYCEAISSVFVDNVNSEMMNISVVGECGLALCHIYFYVYNMVPCDILMGFFKLLLKNCVDLSFSNVFIEHNLYSCIFCTNFN